MVRSTVVGQLYIIYTTLCCRTEVKGLTRPQILSLLHRIHLVTCKLQLATPVSPLNLLLHQNKHRLTIDCLFSFVSEKRLIMATGESQVTETLDTHVQRNWRTMLMAVQTARRSETLSTSTSSDCLDKVSVEALFRWRRWCNDGHTRHWRVR